MRRVAIVVLVVVGVAALGALSWLAFPQRYMVDGLSMGPGLMPGDVVSTGWCSGFRLRATPQRFDRWTMTLPDGSIGLKRMIGLPGEAVSILHGDMAIDEEVILKSPQFLAQTGSVVAADDTLDAATWSLGPSVVLDDASFAPHEKSRVLFSVRDVGFAAEVSVLPAAIASGPVRVRAEAGPLRIGWRLKAPGRYCVVAGRLDGHAVAAVWPVSPSPVTQTHRNWLPSGAPDSWDIARPWPEDGSHEARDADDLAPRLAVTMIAADHRGATIDRIVTWRDILYRPAADGVARWSLGPRDIFVLGDFPSASRDSRHFGPLPMSSLRHRIP
jgi:type IV secretory pathway protease TraF